MKIAILNQSDLVGETNRTIAFETLGLPNVSNTIHTNDFDVICVVEDVPDPQILGCGPDPRVKVVKTIQRGLSVGVYDATWASQWEATHQFVLRHVIDMCYEAQNLTGDE